MKIPPAWWLVPLFAVSLALVPQSASADLLTVAQACPECTEQSQGQGGFFWAMIVMMAAPYLAVGLIGGGIFYAHRRAREEEVDRWLGEE